MNNMQAKQMLKQVDCHGIPRGYNGGYSELYEYCLKSIEKLDKIEKILEEMDPLNTIIRIREVLEQE
jgi:hypothetical protein